MSYLDFDSSNHLMHLICKARQCGGTLQLLKLRKHTEFIIVGGDKSKPRGLHPPPVNDPYADLLMEAIDRNLVTIYNFTLNNFGLV